MSESTHQQPAAELAKPEDTAPKRALPEPPRLQIPTQTAMPLEVSSMSISTAQSPTSTIRTSVGWTPVERVDSGLTHPTFAHLSMAGMRPPAPISKDIPSRVSSQEIRPTTASIIKPSTSGIVRSLTASTKRFSASSFATKKVIKYGTGKFSGVELVPQPSDDPEDPLNWPMWKKQLNFWALLYMTALIGVMKTIFVSVNSAIAMNFGVSYTAAAALTGVPTMVSGLTGSASLILARILGKRPVYLAAMTSLFIGTVWNTSLMDSFAQHMAARVFQGIGWGTFDALVLGSIQDTFFEHERKSRIAIYTGVAVATTWGAPLLGGLASTGSWGFLLQFQILSVFLAFGVLLIALGAPETACERGQSNGPNPLVHQSPPRTASATEAVQKYLAKMKPWSYQAPSIDKKLILQVPRAMIAPTTVLLFAVTLLPYAGLWSLSSSLSLIFAAMPFMLPASTIGALMTGPLILATGVAVLLATPFCAKYFTPKVHVTVLAVSAACASAGMLAFGIYIDGCMHMPRDDSDASINTVWDLNFVGANLSFPIVSLLLGLLAAGSLALDSTIRPMVQRSAAFTSSTSVLCLHNTSDLNAGVTCWRNLVAGAFIIGIPNVIWTWDGLKAATLGMGLTQICVATIAGSVWWMWEENVIKMDGRVMKLINLSTLLQKEISFFDMD